MLLLQHARDDARQPGIILNHQNAHEPTAW
jgi:hypothetical protein